ncbi:D-alanyl-D-alanine carboxypeptidase/D-alanyl-D-alanine carboxypeptidase (penicillin-binding protein 5/6) [Ochrobactrum daejeonense]|uniref:D-alanyl-D-alanine carboxypeptidase/D-alanyl-D-alanine carboxypeptidase (Penicillin-binding protein 5/6) n=1 Tax=Brucella daejeonensis TaxID=659015 RepID=A0A7W9B0B4_9HYPH|nr:D-alanyl-D-alanine carboxypeptidase family protein [Brucella daejeonensis]MBB5703474.1 D-alanyl-D-alanine carboxypeptidase/D-alanyl-D-alanine carboxypeptidase (penicillin-binding protein 5/6) [Brucella daejeonensis]
MLKSSSRFSRLIASLALGASVLCTSASMASTSWVVFDADSGRMLGQDDAHLQHAPASLAKMMTLYLAFEALKTGRLHWDDAMPISKNAASKVRMKLWLKPGETITVHDAIYGMIVVSANDAATVMGEYLGGSEAAFGRLMTQRARQIGMKSTFFVNPSGLTAKATQLTTARDMAILGMSLRRDFPDEYALFSTRSFTFRNRVLNGHNSLMYRYQGVDGIKTGYTDVSGYNLVSSAIINDRHLVGVVLGAGSARQRDDQMAKLLTRFSTEKADNSEQVVAMTQPTAHKLAPARPKTDAVADLIDDSSIEQGDGGFLIASAASASVWTIQLGATPTLAGAKQLQAKYRPIVAKVAPGLKAEISPAKKRRTVYRVRFAGFRDSESAEKACVQMTRRNIACLPIRN